MKSHTYTYTLSYTQKDTHIDTHRFIYVHRHTYTHMQAHIHTHTCIFIDTHTHINTYILKISKTRFTYSTPLCNIHKSENMFKSRLEKEKLFIRNC